MDVIELTDAIEARGKGTMANRTLALVSTVFAFGVDKGVVEANPAYRVKKPGEERTRDRVLNEGEIRALWTALESEPLKWRAIFRLALLTAQRRSEITGMRWDEVDLDGGWWTIPAERAKNGLAHRVPLVGEAARIVRELARKPHDPVFVFRGGRVDRPIANLQKPARRLKVKSGDELRKAIPSALPDGQPVDFRFHDLRRTAASLMTGSKIPRLVVSKILNHVERGITAVYDRHAYDSEKRGALTRWDVRLRQILTGKAAAKVVELRA
jgi:integrase